jgi:hypothetical protein
MQTTIVPAENLVAERDTSKLRRESVTGWLRTHDSRLLAPTFHYSLDEARPLVAAALANSVSQQIGGAIVGPRELTLADRLVLAEFTFRDTKRRIAVQTIAVWLSLPHPIDWAVRMYYAAWNAYLTSQALTGWLGWQDQGILPVTALRRARERLLHDSVGVLTRLELIEFLKHLDALTAEW